MEGGRGGSLRLNHHPTILNAGKRLPVGCSCGHVAKVNVYPLAVELFSSLAADRAALIPSPRHKCTYVKRFAVQSQSHRFAALLTHFDTSCRSIIIPFLLRYHKSLNARFTAAVDSSAAGHISAVPVRASVTSLMVMLAAAGHVVRALQSWDVSCCTLATCAALDA